MVLYYIYKNAKKVIQQKLPQLHIVLEEKNLPELKEQIIEVVKLSSKIIPVVAKLNNNENDGHDSIDMAAEEQINVPN